jgi:gamma-butyrobetaine dioxygenase
MRNFNILDVSKNIRPIKIHINKDGNLIILWNEKKHKSIFQKNWLRNYCYTIKNKQNYISPYKLWDSSIKKNINKFKFEYNEIMNSDIALLNWLEILHSYGLAIIRNSPVKKNSAFKLLNRISHVRETFFGTPFEVINIPKPNNQAYTADALTSHTDLPYYEYAPGYQFLHCLNNDASGGMSTSVDSFKIANFLKEKNIDIFNLLINTPVKFKDNDYTQDKTRIHYSPIINILENGDYNDVRFNMGAMGILDIDPNLMKNFYLAYRKFASLLNSNDYLIKFKLKAGDIFCFNNRRVLHGRTKFDANSGHRHLQGYYVDRDEILSRLNFLKKINI